MSHLKFGQQLLGLTLMVIPWLLKPILISMLI